MKGDRVKIKRDDTVEVIAGREKGKRGKVIRVDRKKERVLVEGVNFVKRHTRPNQQVRQGGIIEKEAPIDASNVMIVDPQTNAPTRVRAGEKDGKKVRIAAKSGAVLD